MKHLLIFVQEKKSTKDHQSIYIKKKTHITNLKFMRESKENNMGSKKKN